MRYNLLLFLLTVICVACKGQSHKAIQGGVYVSQEIIKNRNINYELLKPILALRIDKIVSDTLLTKYRFGQEATMDEDFIYRSSCKCYESNKKVLFAPSGEVREKVYLKFKTSKELELFYFQDNNKVFKQFKLTYIDTVDIATHRNIYYAEDSFELFSE